MVHINNLNPNEQERVIAFIRDLARCLRRIKQDQTTEDLKKMRLENDHSDRQNNEKRDDKS